MSLNNVLNLLSIIYYLLLIKESIKIQNYKHVWDIYKIDITIRRNIF